MENQKEIRFTKSKLPWGWLGNMSPFPVVYQGQEWRTTEALFQALRFSDPVIRELIRKEKSPMGAKLLAKGKVHIMTLEPMSEGDVENMRLCIQLKIIQHPHLKNELLSTNYPIYEDVTARGRRGSNLFWGAIKLESGEWEGQNVLGNLWMELRELLINDPDALRN